MYCPKVKDSGELRIFYHDDPYIFAATISFGCRRLDELSRRGVIVLPLGRWGMLSLLRQSVNRSDYRTSYVQGAVVVD